MTAPALAHAASLLRTVGVPVELDDVEVDRTDSATDWAVSGATWLTGMADGPPLLPPGTAASAARGALLAFELLSALAGRRVRLDGRRLLGERAAAAGLRRKGPWSPGGTFRILPTADGALGLSLARPSDVELVPALVGKPADDPWRDVGQWAAGSCTLDAVGRIRLLGLAGCPVQAPSGGAAPLCEPFWPSGGHRGSTSALRPIVVDLSSLWAGPLCTHLLGLAGARVVKVESIQRPDGARRGPAAFYDLLHAGHESVVLDLAEPRGRAQLAGLVDAADVVVESSRPRALAQLAIDADAVVADARDKTWVSITAYGRRGPGAGWVGFGDDTAVAAGLVVADPDTGTLLPCGDAIADPLSGVHAAVLALASVLAGGRRLLDVALHDVVRSTLVGVSPWPPAGVAATDASVEPPRIRPPSGKARPLGADTTRVLGELGLL